MSAMKLDEMALEAFREALELPRWYSDAELLSAIRAYLTSATPPDVAGLVEAYAADYDYRADNGGGYTPTDGERAMLVDFGHGLLSQAATALRLSAGGGWRPIESAPELDRVIVAGWQKPARSCAGYWWMHEDVIINGQPDEHPDALLWHPFPSRPAGLPASPTVEDGQ